jgi:hypothetical protein
MLCSRNILGYILVDLLKEITSEDPGSASGGHGLKAA